jgi:hypothetical protein
MGVLVRWVDRHLRLTRRPQAGEPAQPAEQHPLKPLRLQTSNGELQHAAGNGPPRRQRFVLAPARHPRRERSASSPPALCPRAPRCAHPPADQHQNDYSGATWTASKPPSLTARRFRRGAAGIAARARRCQAAWVSNQTEPRSWPAVRWTSALRAAARRRSRGDGGLGAAFLDALDVVLGEGGPQGQFGDGQAEGGADVVQGLAKGQGLAGSRAARDHRRVLRGAPSGCGSWSSHACLS